MNKANYVRVSIRGRKFGNLKAKYYVHPQLAVQVIQLIGPHIDRNTGYVTTDASEVRKDAGAVANTKPEGES